MSLHIVPVDERTVAEWQAIHNTIIPPDPLSVDDVRARLTRHRLTLAYVGGTLVGNATVRPPGARGSAATVIVRILPEHRRRGYGSSYLDAVLADARSLGPYRVETVVLTANGDGLDFAFRRGFVEFDRYVLEEGRGEYVELYLDADADRAPGSSAARVS